MMCERFVDSLHAEVVRERPLGERYPGPYLHVYSGFCADSATGDKETWRRFMRNEDHDASGARDPLHRLPPVLLRVQLGAVVAVGGVALLWCR